MAQSAAHRTKRNLIARWLWEMHETDESIPYAKYWIEAADLIKFFSANGCELRVVDPT